MDGKEVLQLAKEASDSYKESENKGFALTVIYFFIQELEKGKYGYKLVKDE